MATITQLSYDPHHRQGPVPMTITGPKPAPPAAPAPKVTTVSTALATMENARSAHQKHLAEVARSRESFTADGYRAKVLEFADSPEAKAVDEHEAAVIARRDKAAADYEQTLANLSRPGDSAEEQRNSRAWDRQKRTIDHADSPVAAARAAINQAKPEELGVLLDELPAHLAATGHPTDWITSSVEQVVPELAAARGQLDKASRAAEIAQYDAARLREGFASGRPPVELVDMARFDPDL
jgi:hypothetical protein